MQKIDFANTPLIGTLVVRVANSPRIKRVTIVSLHTLAVWSGFITIVFVVFFVLSAWSFMAFLSLLTLLQALGFELVAAGLKRSRALLSILGLLIAGPIPCALVFLLNHAYFPN